MKSNVRLKERNLKTKQDTNYTVICMILITAKQMASLAS